MKRFTKNLLLAVGLLSGSIVTSNAMAPRPALIQAVWDRDAAKIQALLDAGVDINERDDYNGRTALMTAARTGNLEIMDILLSHGADATLHDNENQTALPGTYLIACSFYYSLFGKNPVNNSYNPTGLTSGNAVTIRKAVYDYMQNNK